MSANARTKAWLRFQQEHYLGKLDLHEIWNAGFDAGWYARLERERKLAEQDEHSVQIGHDPDVFVSVSKSPSGQS